MDTWCNATPVLETQINRGVSYALRTHNCSSSSETALVSYNKKYPVINMDPET